MRQKVKQFAADSGSLVLFHYFSILALSELEIEMH